MAERFRRGVVRLFSSEQGLTLPSANGEAGAYLKVRCCGAGDVKKEQFVPHGTQALADPLHVWPGIVPVAQVLLIGWRGRHGCECSHALHSGLLSSPPPRLA